MAKPINYPEGYCEYLRKICDGSRDAKSVADEMNRHFGMNIAVGAINTYRKRHQIKLNHGDGRFKKGQVSPTKGRKIDKNSEVYKKMSLTFFKKGHSNNIEYDIGTVREETRCLRIKYNAVKNGKYDKNWMPYHRYVWEKAYGKIPDDQCVIFLDGNFKNCSLENLALVSRAELVRLNQSHFRFKDPEATKCGITLTRLKLAVLGKTKKIESLKREKKQK